jgi:hypothetical protein
MFSIASIALHGKLLSSKHLVLSLICPCKTMIVDNPIPPLIINGTMNRDSYERIFLRRKSGRTSIHGYKQKLNCFFIDHKRLKEDSRRNRLTALHVTGKCCYTFSYNNITENFKEFMINSTRC